MLFGNRTEVLEFDSTVEADSSESLSMIFLIFLCAVCLATGFAPAAHAYLAKDSVEPELFEEIASTAPVDRHKPVVLYDNLHYRHGEKTEDYPLLGRGCVSLVPADIININPMSLT